MYQKQMTDPDILTALSQTDIPPNLVQWLTKLKTLQGVPFNYLVGDDRFLPPESIRFFQLDDNWQNALLDGALSIGRHYTPSPNVASAPLTDLTHGALLKASVTAEMPRLRRRQLQMDTGPSSGPGPGVTGGFLLRSKAVNAWKSMDVAAYAEGNSPYDYEQQKITSEAVRSLEILRLERLSAGVLLGIFNGPVYELVLHQPPEAIHFGFGRVDVKNNTAYKDLRVPETYWDDPGNKRYDNEKYKDQQLSGVFLDTNTRVLDMAGLSASLAKKLNSYKKAPAYYQATPDANYKDHLVSSDFGLEMVQGVGLVSFINDDLPAKK